MNRRAFLALIGAATPFMSRAQQPAMPVIGIPWTLVFRLSGIRTGAVGVIRAEDLVSGAVDASGADSSAS